MDDFSDTSVKVYFAMSKTQAEKQGCPRCLVPHFPESRAVYFRFLILNTST